MSKTIADDSVVSRNDMRKRLTSKFNPFVAQYATKNEDYSGKTLQFFQEQDFTVPLIEHFVAHLEDICLTHGTARVYLSALYTLIKERHLELYNSMVVPTATEWQRKLRIYFQKECHNTRTTLVNHKMPINRADNHYICWKLFERHLHEESALQAFDWANGGRISEGPGLEWRDFELHELICQNSQVSCMRVRCSSSD